jgi:hypothetical protein
MIGEEAGSTEMLPIGFDNLDKRFSKMTLGGIIASLIMMVLSIVPLFFSEYIGMEIFCILSMFLPVSAYYFFGSILPMSSEGVKNDGATYFGIKKQTDCSKVMLSLLAIHAQLYYGKTPSEIDEKYYFDLPQLAEDDLFFTLLLNARYNYYLDKGDYQNAKTVSDRLLSVIEYMPKSVRYVIKTDALYNACTFDYNEDSADDLMYELEKYLNKTNDLTAVRVKLAYLAFIRRETTQLETFYAKGVKDAKKHPIKGLGAYEKKLLDDIKAKYSGN